MARPPTFSDSTISLSKCRSCSRPTMTPAFSQSLKVFVLWRRPRATGVSPGLASSVTLTARWRWLAKHPRPVRRLPWLKPLLTNPGRKPSGIHPGNLPARLEGAEVLLKSGDRRAERGTWWRLTQAGRTCSDDGLGAVGDVQFGQDVRDVVAHRLWGQRKSSGNCCIILSSRHHG